MKKLLSILLAVIMIVGMIPMSIIPAYAAELPTVEIGTGNDLVAFIKNVNDGKYQDGVNAKLTADIDITMTEGLSDFDGVGYDDGFGYFNLTVPIGRDEEHPFKGTFDGQGHYIEFWFDTDGNYFESYGLFGVNYGTIKNLTVGIEGANWLYFWGGYNLRLNVGGLCATNYGTIENCVNRANLVADRNAGGICATNYGTVDSCKNYANTEAGRWGGGIVGTNAGTVINCLNYGHLVADSNTDSSLTQETANFSGGIVGKLDGGKVYNCANYGAIEQSREGTPAGIVGRADSGEIAGCFVGGTVTGKNAHTVIGRNDGATITSVYYEIKDGFPADDNAEGVEKALIDSGYAVSLLRDAAKNITGAKTWYIGANGYPAFEGSDVPRFLTPSISCTVDENGIATVSGTGDIPTNAFANDNTIKEVILGEGITSVGTNAFTGCANLHTITVKGQSITFETYALRGIAGANAFTVGKSDGTKTDTVGSEYLNAIRGGIKAVYIHRFDYSKDEVLTPSTCSANGTATHFCKFCEYSVVLQDLPLEPHTYLQNKTEVVAPTCGEDGYTVHYCDKCDYFYEATRIVATGDHHYTGKKADKVVAPTCNENGYTVHYCDDCGYEFKDTVVPSKGSHSYDDSGRCTKCGNYYYNTLVDRVKLGDPYELQDLIFTASDTDETALEKILAIEPDGLIAVKKKLDETRDYFWYDPYGIDDPFTTSVWILRDEAMQHNALLKENSTATEKLSALAALYDAHAVSQFYRTLSVLNENNYFAQIYSQHLQDSLLGGEAALMASSFNSNMKEACYHTYRLFFMSKMAKKYLGEKQKDVSGWNLAKNEYEDVFVKEDGIAKKYDRMIEEQWLGYIKSWKETDGVREPEVIPLKMIKVTTSSLGVKKSTTQGATLDMVENANAKLQGKMYTVLEQNDITRLVNHIIENKNNVFVKGNSGETVNCSPLEMLVNIGFISSAEIPENSAGRFICASGCYSDHEGTTEYDAELSATVLDCVTKNEYRNGQLVNNAPQWFNDKYYDYEYEDGKAIWDSRDEGVYFSERTFFVFAPADIHLSSTEEFADFIKEVANGETFLNKKIILDCDVDLTGVKYESLWPAAKSESSFRGTFDGDNHVISGLTSSTSDSVMGLFRKLGDNATVNSLILKNFNIKCKDYAGALAGITTKKVTLNNVMVEFGTVQANNAGGLVGKVQSYGFTLNNCSSSAAVSGYNAGGLTGYLAEIDEINGFTNYGIIRGDESGGTAGGVVGYIYSDRSSVYIKNSKNTGPVSAAFAGGMVGYSEDTCFYYTSDSNSGSISGIVAGGMQGKSDADTDVPVWVVIKQCTNSGSVTASAEAAGMVAYITKGNSHATGEAPTDIFTECTNAGNITSTGKKTAGGIIATHYAIAQLTQCKNTGEIDGGTVGGLVAWNEDDDITFTDCSNEGNIIGTSDAGGIIGYGGDCSDDPEYYFYGKTTNSGDVTGGGHAGGIMGCLRTDDDNVFEGCENSGNIESTGDGCFAGGIVGKSNGGGNFKNCKNTGSVKAKSCAGGILGWNEDDRIDFSNSENTGSITSLTAEAGGIAGYIGDCDENPYYTGSGCKNSGRIRGVKDAGGIIGKLDTDNQNNDFSNCINTGNVESTASGYSAGGIIGATTGGGNLTYCRNTGCIKGSTAVGGILGWCEDDPVNFTGSVNGDKNAPNSSTKGRIEATKDNAGGIAGRIGNSKNNRKYILKQCENYGTVISVGDAGGIVGYLDTDNHNHDFSYCYNAGNVTSTSGNNSAGGIIGGSEGGGSLKGCINVGFIKGKNSSPFIGWNEDDPWDYSETVNQVVPETPNNNDAPAETPVVPVNEDKSEEKNPVEQTPTEETPTTPEQTPAESNDPSNTASVLSDGNLWIILVVAVLAIGGIAALVIVKKKKKPVTANGAVDSDDE